MQILTGFVRSCAVAFAALLVPAVWAGAVAVCWWWRAGPWSWIAPVLWAAILTLVLARPVCRMFRALVRRWAAVVIPGGYREPGPVTKLSTGFWWNGHSYAKTRERALEEQRWRTRLTDPAVRRDLFFVAVAPFAGLVAAVPGAALVLALTLRGWWLTGIAVAVATAPFAWRVAEPAAVRFLRPSAAMRLAERVDELTAQRADTTVAQAAEIRRIERDLHDGAQARLVALGLSLATAERLMKTDPDKAAAVLREARTGAASSLSELRELVRGISPPVLNERGLIDAVRAFAMDSPLETTVRTDLRLRLDPPIESALYFGIAELLTNAVKHARADRATIAISRDDTHLVVEVEDDGRGGATVAPGGGLDGLRRRLAVFDGTLEITSPAGGPTRARMAVPCESL
ncbi:sensor histidine kinase [Dactylosporangium matsuzakiense]|nr:sensor histidine kinase [Dactylosporangium matsuzakiense]UWZ48811.1 sensor histidine kinase [Dactylosporangium matsuzakiense]